MFKVEIEKLKIYTKIGTSVQERRKQQLLLVSLYFSYNVNYNKNLNEIKNLKSYSDIKKTLVFFIRSSRYKTLEKLITESSKLLKNKYNLKKIVIKIEKPEIAKKYKCASISVTK